MRTFYTPNDDNLHALAIFSVMYTSFWQIIWLRCVRPSAKQCKQLSNAAKTKFQVIPGRVLGKRKTYLSTLKLCLDCRAFDLRVWPAHLTCTFDLRVWLARLTRRSYGVAARRCTPCTATVRAPRTPCVPCAHRGSRTSRSKQAAHFCIV